MQLRGTLNSFTETIFDILLDFFQLFTFHHPQYINTLKWQHGKCILQQQNPFNRCRSKISEPINIGNM
jgi:hypothetical protein